MITFSQERSLGFLQRSTHPYARVVKRRYLHQWLRYRSAVRAEREALLRWSGAEERLADVLQHAWDHSAWQRSRMRDAGLQRHDLRDPRALQALPPMTRADVQRHSAALIDRDAPAWVQADYFRGRTSGSTGEPLSFVVDGRAFFWFWAFIDFAAHYYGVALDLMPLQLELVQLCALQHSPEYGSLLPLFHGVRFEKRHIDSKATQRDLEKRSPAVFTGDPDSLWALSRWNVKPKLVLSSAFAWPAGKREALEAQIGCPVVDYYSAQETGVMAIACRNGHGKHVLEPACIVETAADQRVLVTNLRNRHFPLLRYAVGDLATLTRDRCSCGLRGTRVVSLDGRAHVSFAAHDGRRFDPNVLNPVLTRMRGVREFSVRELQQGVYRCEVVGAMAHDEHAVLRDVLGRAFGGSVSLEVEQAVHLRSPGQKPRPFVAAS